MDPRLTEARNPRTRAIDRADSVTIVRLIQAEDRAVPEAIASQAEGIARVVDDIVERFRRGGRLVYAGAGAEAVRELGVGPADLVLGIAASGTTPYVLGALREAASLGAGTAFLGCTEPAPEVADLVDHLILPLVGPEVIAGSTRMKAGTATKLVLNAITTAAMVRTGRAPNGIWIASTASSAWRSSVSAAAGAPALAATRWRRAGPMALNFSPGWATRPPASPGSETRR